MNEEMSKLRQMYLATFSTEAGKKVLKDLEKRLTTMSQVLWLEILTPLHMKRGNVLFTFTFTT